LFERAESPLYAIELELKQAFEKVDVVPILADIQDKNQLSKAFDENRPHISIHAWITHDKSQLHNPFFCAFVS
jgi:FlaA1/EpsC-like NDP-sugar epimerase